jgi:hypothetical protein
MQAKSAAAAESPRQRSEPVRSLLFCFKNCAASVLSQLCQSMCVCHEANTQVRRQAMAEKRGYTANFKANAESGRKIAAA